MFESESGCSYLQLGLVERLDGLEDLPLWHQSLLVCCGFQQRCCRSRCGIRVQRCCACSSTQFLALSEPSCASVQQGAGAPRILQQFGQRGIPAQASAGASVGHVATPSAAAAADTQQRLQAAVNGRCLAHRTACFPLHGRGQPSDAHGTPTTCRLMHVNLNACNHTQAEPASAGTVLAVLLMAGSLLPGTARLGPDSGNACYLWAVKASTVVMQTVIMPRHAVARRAPTDLHPHVPACIVCNACTDDAFPLKHSTRVFIIDMRVHSV